MLYILSLYIIFLCFWWFMMIKNELELFFLNIWFFIYCKRVGGLEFCNWLELSLLICYLVFGSVFCNKVMLILRCYNMFYMYVIVNNFYWSLRKSKINGNIVIVKILCCKMVFESIFIVFKIIYMGFVVKI